MTKEKTENTHSLRIATDLDSRLAIADHLKTNNPSALLIA